MSNTVPFLAPLKERTTLPKRRTKHGLFFVDFDFSPNLLEAYFVLRHDYPCTPYPDPFRNKVILNSEGNHVKVELRVPILLEFVVVITK